MSAITRADRPASSSDQVLTGPPAGQRDHADHHRQHRDVAQRVGQRSQDFIERAFGLAGDEVEDERRPRAAVPRAAIAPSIQRRQLISCARARTRRAQPRVGEWVEEQVAGIGGGGVGAFGLPSMGPRSSRPRPLPRQGSRCRSGYQALRSRPEDRGPDDAAAAGADDDGVVDGAADREVEAVGDAEPVMGRDEERPSQQQDGARERRRTCATGLSGPVGSAQGSYPCYRASACALL